MSDKDLISLPSKRMSGRFLPASENLANGWDDVRVRPIFYSRLAT